MTSAGLTPAASAMARTLAPFPCSPHNLIAASRIRAAAVRSSAERMFSRLNMRSMRSQGCPRASSESRCHKNAGCERRTVHRPMPRG
ncbi:Uncharacterised protein [Mycobacteroides abscessus subsp. abscessus]|nr:Uncharacterised protein [Mycobacteroides abscessus subsp. abscessus]